MFYFREISPLIVEILTFWNGFSPKIPVMFCTFPGFSLIERPSMSEKIFPRLLMPSIFIPVFSGRRSWIFPFNVSHSTILFKKVNVAWIGLEEVANLAPPLMSSAIIVPETEWISVKPSAFVIWIRLVEETSRIRGAVIVFREIAVSYTHLDVYKRQE